MATIKGSHRKFKCLKCDRPFNTTIEVRVCHRCKALDDYKLAISGIEVCRKISNKVGTGL